MTAAADAPGERPPRRLAPLAHRLAGLAFLTNALLLAATAALLLLAVHSNAARGAPAVTARTAALAGVAVLFLAALLFLGRGANVTVAALTLGLLGAGQLRLDPRRVAEYPASATRYPAPYVMFTGLAGEGDHNALGYRGRVPAPSKEAGEHRILMIGGSAVYGKGALELTLPFQLQRLSRRRFSPAVSVYNWGVVSQVSGQELATIAHRVPAHAPDVVLLYNGANDVYSPYTADPRPGHPFNFVLSERALGIFQSGDLRALTAGALTQSNLLRAFFPLELSDAAARLGPLRAAAGYGTPRWEEEVTRAYLANVETSCRFTSALGARFVAALQPVVFFTPQADGHGDLGPAFRGYVERAYERIRAGFTELEPRHRERGCTFLDLSRTCAEGECHFSDLVHPTPETRRPIAEALFVHLRDRGLLAARP